MNAKAPAFVGVVAVVATMLTACQGNHTRQQHYGAVRLGDDHMIPKPGAQKIESIMESVELDAPAVTATKTSYDEESYGDDPDDIAEDEIEYTINHGIPIELNDDVQKWITYFSVKDRDRFQRFLDRGEMYREMIYAILDDQGVPRDLYYLAMIESGFYTKARSHASAVGVWQFIKATGRRYGLKVDYYADERQDPVRATIAAALYLKDLHLVFNSWYLAMAAYNAGETRIMGTIMRKSSRDFWELVREKALPSETMNYVPKFLAAVTIGRDPGKYGFREPHNTPLPTLAPVEVPSPVKLAKIAEVTGISKDQLIEYNPHLKHDMTPPIKSYKIWVPKQHVALVESKNTILAQHRVKATVALAENGGTQYHRVRSGENLALIARRYGTSVATLKSINGMRSDRIMAGTRIKVGGNYVAAGSYTKYKVQRGDNLALIARKFKTSVSTLKQLNKLTRTTIYAGQVLKVGTSRM